MRNVRKILRGLGLLLAAAGLLIPLLWIGGAIDGLFAGENCTSGKLADPHQCSEFENVLGTLLTATALFWGGLLMYALSTERFWTWVAKPAGQPRVIRLRRR